MLLAVSAVDLQSKITPSNGKKVTAKDFNAYLAANKVRTDLNPTARALRTLNPVALK